MNLPRILIISTVSGKASEIARNIGAECISTQDDIKYHLWNIDNKYYTSQVLLCTTESTSCELTVDGVEALIVHHNPLAENAEQMLEQWSSLILSLSEAEVLLFSCDHITDVITRDKVLQWCISRKFELVELSRSITSENVESDLENGKCGIERIIEALHAHTWPNMVFKGKPSFGETQTDVREVKEQLENVHLTQDPIERLHMESVLDGIMGGENSDFGELFGQLLAMKEHAASLPTNQRRIAAEQLVTAFWKAMGGDSSELDD